ncbi:hypothetical protein [Rhodococcus chondri]|uniref:Uncharacterized protein n=1 Tax=Rhodococcus chondri TaxID=3065941 RepID=A0ABU7JXP7_9NOCA|nr:hypothetical protein [Rhodococcus sp. CC-R104]MEE2034786.1 hypothetical protein [Rhodococcus sp. CC-R104]
MAERGATPQVSPLRRGLLRVIHLFDPLRPDSYLAVELMTPARTSISTGSARIR